MGMQKKEREEEMASLKKKNSKNKKNKKAVETPTEVVDPKTMQEVLEKYTTAGRLYKKERDKQKALKKKMDEDKNAEKSHKELKKKKKMKKRKVKKQSDSVKRNEKPKAKKKLTYDRNDIIDLTQQHVDNIQNENSSHNIPEIAFNQN